MNDAPLTVTEPVSTRPLPVRTVFSTWWPLAASWLMMGLELPAVSAVIARLANPEIHLAAYGGVVFPLALLVESPIIMLLAASTALSRDWDAYRRLRQFMIRAGLILTGLHVVIVLSPLYDFIVEHLLHSPPEIRAPARVGLLIMTPWTGSIAFRRFQQGVLIRFHRSKWVGLGTMVRLLANLCVLGAGLWIRDVPGIIVGTTAVAAGVLAEAIFAAFSVRPVLRRQMPEHRPEDPVLTWPKLFHFYVPLALTPLMSLLVLPILSAGMGRMPRALESLATLPALNGLIFVLRSLALAYNEVVVALFERPASRRALMTFTRTLTVVLTGLLALLSLTPLGDVWFRHISGLQPALASLGAVGLVIAIALPGLGVFQSWYQGILVSIHRTRGISEAVGVALIGVAVAIGAGIYLGTIPGLWVGMAAQLAGNVLQTLWLKWRCQVALARVAESPKG
jgi:progressive ankylosis protein